MNKAFELDWSRVCEDRFTRWIAKEGGVRTDEEMVRATPADKYICNVIIDLHNTIASLTSPIVSDIAVNSFLRSPR